MDILKNDGRWTHKVYLSSVFRNNNQGMNLSVFSLRNSDSTHRQINETCSPLVIEWLIFHELVGCRLLELNIKDKIIVYDVYNCQN